MTEKTDDREEIGLEDLFERLEAAIHSMEEEDISLEDSFRLYHEGIDILKNCNDRIDEVEKKMLILDEEGGVHEFE
ncbi:MAG: exodeoxyribonuclease VII small subunit [Dorea sp.]|jgi:exodeoxyribonuclease VII small subunit|nr:exodeoxyribonuclease VII small subunit [Dorea sp.]